MSNLELDLAIRNGSFKIYMAIFNASSPRMFLVESPRTTLTLSLIPEKRKPQVKGFLNGVNPQGLVSVVELWKFYSSGVRIDGQTLSGFDAMAHILSRILPIQTEDVEKMIAQKFEQGFNEITFITSANAKGCESIERIKSSDYCIGKDFWLILKAIPETDERLQGLNKILAKIGAHYRCFTSKTYVQKTYGTD